ncbi:hypothetical protein BGZ98_001381 [Dissophora globulifera]|nr:hypothetical protein BGZ98_001381 [Dissophora globulifera]
MAKPDPILIPELADFIAAYLPAQSLAVCLRVSRDWHGAFLPLLYRNIAVFDFDYHAKHVDHGHPSGSVTSSQRSATDVGYGGSRVHKYTHFTRTIVAANVHSFKYLGASCTRLTHASIIQNQNFTTARHAPPLLPQATRTAWNKYFAEHSFPRTVDLWVQLIERNPSLVCVRMDLEEVMHGSENIAEALGSLKHLQELTLFKPTQRNAVEIFLDHCPGIRTFEFISESPRTIFTPVEPAKTTQIRHLKFGYPFAPEPRVCAYLLKRCPNLEWLTLPLNARLELLTTAGATINSLNIRSTLTRVDFDGNISLLHVPQAIFCSLVEPENVSSITFSRARVDFESLTYLADPGLRERIRVLVFSFALHIQAHNTVAVLETCPNLEVFELENAHISVHEFLDLNISCQASLTSLKLSISCTKEEAAAFEIDREIEVCSGIRQGDRVKKQDGIVGCLARLGALKSLTLDGTLNATYVSAFPLVPDDVMWTEFKNLRLLQVLRILGSIYNVHSPLMQTL